MCSFMDLIEEVRNWVIALSMQGPNKRATKTMKRGLAQEVASFSLLFMICSHRRWALSLTISDWFASKQHSSFKKRRVLPLQLPVGLSSVQFSLSVVSDSL